MRTNIVIDSKLMKETIGAFGKTIKKDTVEARIRELILKRTNYDLLPLQGKGWGWDEEEPASSQ